MKRVANDLSAASSSTGENVGMSDGEGDTGSNSRNADDKGEVCGGHFSKGPWLALCSATDAPIPEEGASAARGTNIINKHSRVTSVWSDSGCFGGVLLSALWATKRHISRCLDRLVSGTGVARGQDNLSCADIFRLLCFWLTGSFWTDCLILRTSVY